MRKKKSSFLGRWSLASGSMLFIRIPLVNPEPWLGALVKRIWFVWTPWFWMIAAAAMVFSILRLVLHSDAFGDQLYDFFTPANIPLLWLSIILTKTCHEFGHATTCKYFGGQVPEMGMCFICLTPCGYVDASDAWMMPKRAQKIAVAVSGLVTEFVIATIALNVWLGTSPGLIHTLAFNVMLVASINALLMNLNPLMKFDGYYMLSDLLEIPNLRTKALAYCGGWLKHLFFNAPKPSDEAEQGRIFLSYAIVAFAYIIFITVSLSLIFLRFLDPVGLKTAGIVLGLFIFLSLVGLPIIKAFMDMTRMSKVRADLHPWRRASWSFPLLALFLGALWFFPVKHIIKAQGVVVPVQRDEVTAPVGGWIDAVEVMEREMVSEGQLLLRLANPQVRTEWKLAKIELENALLRRNQNLGSSSTAENYRDPALEENRVELLRSRVQRLGQQVELLNVRAPRDGVVKSIPERPLDRVVGRAFNQGEPLLAVENTDSLEIVAALPEFQASRIEVDSPVAGTLRAGLDDIVGQVYRLPVRPVRAEELKPAMYTDHGGVLPRGSAGATDDLLRRFPVFVIRVELEESPQSLRPGMRARLRIEGKPVRLGPRTWENFKRYLSDKSGGIL